MVPDKSPGTDGLPCEFYKVFWKDVAEILINSFNYSYEIGKLSISQRRGIIKLIPKKDANLNSIKNWRPLKCHYDENRIFSIKAVLKHKQVACMRRTMPFTIF